MYASPDLRGEKRVFEEHLITAPLPMLDNTNQQSIAVLMIYEVTSHICMRTCLFLIFSILPFTSPLFFFSLLLLLLTIRSLGKTHETKPSALPFGVGCGGTME